MWELQFELKIELNTSSQTLQMMKKRWKLFNDIQIKERGQEKHKKTQSEHLYDHQLITEQCWITLQQAVQPLQTESCLKLTLRQS